MKFECYTDDRPNGFHDAKLTGYEVKFGTKTLELKISVWVGDLQSQDGEIRERMRDGILRAEELQFFAMELPDWTYPYEIDESYWLDLQELTGSDAVINGKDFSSEPYQVFGSFINDTNRNLYFAAGKVSFEWL